MRIILVQAEIETALKQYVLGQINIAEGQDITIDFKATRGEDGATAEINISKPGAIPNGQKQPQTVATSRSTPAAVTTQSGGSTTSPAPVVAETAPITSTTEQSVDNASTTTDTKEEEFKPPAFLNQGTKEAETPAEQVAEAETPPPPSGRSLFANLTKPVNETKPA